MFLLDKFISNGGGSESELFRCHNKKPNDNRMLETLQYLAHYGIKSDPTQNLRFAFKNR